MKTAFPFFVIGILIGTGATAQKLPRSKVPAEVISAFTKTNSGVTASWEIEKGNYEAGFNKHGVSNSNLYSPTGRLLETEITINKNSIPPAALEYVKTNFKGRITEAAKITKADGTVNYEAEISKLDLIFDETGKFIRADKD